MTKPKKQNFKNLVAPWPKLAMAAVFCFLAVFAACTKSSTEQTNEPRPFEPVPENVVAVDRMENVDFSKFKHDSGRHKTIACLYCHERNDESPRPKFASHKSCNACHAPQFEDPQHAICLTCHTEQGSKELKPFPSVTSFDVKFNHTEHFKQAACTTCHQTQGAGMTVPAGGNAHASCFECHTADKTVGEKNIGSCATCHEPGTPDPMTDSTKNIGFNFDHARHSGVSCNSCHNPTSGNQMSAVTVAMHGKQANSCATCHNEQKAFGANDFSDCRKCHTEVSATRSFGVKFNHGQHAKTNCAVCHKPGKGVNFSVPNGEAAHTTCFSCHSPTKDTGNFTTSKCFACHQVGGTNNIQPSRAVIPGNFAHTKHSFMDCDACHTPAGGKMNVPTAVMHKKSAGLNCASCHNNETAFGEDFTNCKKCHLGGNFKN